jgi:hypothetical protein
MLPAIVMPMHDPAGLMFPHLEAITPQLRIIFAQAFVSITPITGNTQPKYLAWLETEDFYQVLYHQTNVSVGDDFLTLYEKAALAWEDPFLYSCNPQQLKEEREQSIRETRKRLAYVIPMLQLLDEAADL